MDTIEQRILESVDRQAEDIVRFANDLYDHAELGYKEFRTAEKFADLARRQGLATETGLAVTGVRATLGNAQGPTVALLGELDALRIPQHAHANPQTQAAHCCGHHAQLAGIAGALLALTQPDITAALDGKIAFFAVPAEEYGEIAYKNQLRAEGKIVYGGGKAELIRQGAFDDIDISIAHHLRPDCGGVVVGTGSNNGFVSKVIRLHGRAAHAAGCPEAGVNALNAASLGLQALALQRETFRDEDRVRVHPILTAGGNLVNVVPDEAVVETLVRARTDRAVDDAAAKTDRAFKAGAFAVGAGYTIDTMPGYLPVLPQKANPVLLAAARDAAPDYPVSEADTGAHSGGSTDLGDLQHIQPVLYFETGGCTGGLHTRSFAITDEKLAYITTAKVFALSAYRLLRDGAAAAKEILQAYQPVYTKQQYLAVMDGRIHTEHAGITA